MSAGHPRTQFDLVESFWEQLVAVDDRVLVVARRRAARRRMRRTLVLVVLTILALGAIALAAGELLSGEDAPRVYPEPAEFGVGAPLPGRTVVLAERQLDPVGGLLVAPWGIRAFFTDRDNICLQSGRVVDGKLVALGVSGAFGNDGLAHELPLEAEGCTHYPDDAMPRVGLVSMSQDTSGLAEHRGGSDADRRAIVLGTAPHGVTSVELVAGTEHHVHAVSDLAFPTYLFVLVADPIRAPDPLLTYYTYDDGLRCLGNVFSHPDPSMSMSRACLLRQAGR